MGATDIHVRDHRDVMANCKVIAEVLARFGDKWSAQIIATLASGEAIRYTEMSRRIEGISQRMLTLTLRSLEQGGLVSRKPFATIPPRVDYRLTELGKSLLVPLRALHDWSELHGSDWITAAQKSRNVS